MKTAGRRMLWEKLVLITDNVYVIKDNSLVNHVICLFQQHAFLPWDHRC
jgi:hypothetical protein